MFNNLIESSSHANEFKRRGSFVIFTMASYAVLFAVAGVLSIYAYDARLEEPASEITMLSPVEFETPSVETVRPTNVAPSSNNQGASNFVRRNPMASVNEPQLAPKTTSAVPNTNPPLPPGVPFTISDHDSDPGARGPGNSGSGGGGTDAGGGTPVIDVGKPPPAPVEKPKPRIITKRVLNGEAVSLPKPPYPPLAKQMGVQGSVNVQVLVDENGRVISAKAVSGNPVLVPAAQRAALEARFSPTMLGDQPVKVSGVIIYNFQLQR
ncbi:MAG: energy transducer TonB [Acidobacteriota bacterium]|nr:energy transducer TonB [Acidobacteriota bacterium]